MLRSGAKSFPDIRSYLDQVPVIETHEHYVGKTEPVGDVLEFIVGGNYYWSDFESASFARGESLPADAPFERRFERFRETYRRSDKTAYARGMRMGLEACWGAGAIDDEAAMSELSEKLKTRGQPFYERKMEEYGIKAAVVDCFADGFIRIVEGGEPYSRYCRFAFPLPEFHNIQTKDDIMKLQRRSGMTITSLDDYIEAFGKLLQKCVDFGVVCMKDQSAYRRSIGYGNPARAEAEEAFNAVIGDPRGVLDDSRSRALDDWLFHRFMRLAARHGLPVQIHTGHMAGIRNDIVKTNAALLTPVLELHQDVRFDLFHGNWPYMGEFLFLGKNYPNVWLDLCWVQVIDPLYSIELMKRAVMTVPHAKIMAFGGDTGAIEWAVGYLILARDNVACALSELVDAGWIDAAEAKAIAADWFFNNPNEFFGLGFERFTP